MTKLSSPAIQELVKYAESKGFTWNGKLSGRGHIILRHPNGGRVVLAGTPSRDPNQMNISRKTIDREAARGREG
jgi:predicted RNA binding protein YcfA (HicA-like mRNA interferase family)